MIDLIRRRLAGTSAGAVLQTAGSRVLVLGLNLCTSTFVAHFLGPAGRGELSALILWPPLLSSIFSLGIPFAFLYYERKEPKDRDSLFSAAMLITAALSVVMVLAGWLALPFFLTRYSAHTVHVAQLVLLLAPEVLLSYTLVALYQASNRFGLFNLQRYLPVLVTLVSLVIVQKAGMFSATTAGLCYAIPPVPIFFWALFRLRGTVRFSLVNLRGSARRLLSYGSRASGLALLGTIAQQVDQVFVISLLSASSMGIYAVALSASRIPNFVFVAMNDAILAKSMRMPVSEMTAFVGRASRIAAIGGALSAGLLALLLPLLVPFFYGAAFRASIAIVDVLLVEVIASGVANVLGVAYLAVGRPGLVSLVLGGSLLVTIPLMLFFIPRMGLTGVAVSLLISSTARVVAMLLLYRVAVGAAPPSLFIKPSDVRFILDRVRGFRPAAAA